MQNIYWMILKKKREYLIFITFLIYGNLSYQLDEPTEIKGLINIDLSIEKYDNPYKFFCFPVIKSSTSYLYINITGTFNYDTIFSIYFNERNDPTIITGTNGNFEGNTVYSINLKKKDGAKYEITKNVNKGSYFILIYQNNCSYWYESEISFNLFAVSIADLTTLSLDKPNIFQINDEIQEYTFIIPSQNNFKSLFYVAQYEEKRSYEYSRYLKVFLATDKQFSENLVISTGDWGLLEIKSNLTYFVKFQKAGTSDRNFIGKIFLEFNNYSQFTLITKNKFYTFNNLKRSLDGVYDGSSNWLLYYKLEESEDNIYIGFSFGNNYIPGKYFYDYDFTFYYAQTVDIFEDMTEDHYKSNSFYSIGGFDKVNSSDLNFKYYFTIEKEATMKGIRILLTFKSMSYPDNISFKILSNDEIKILNKPKKSESEGGGEESIKPKDESDSSSGIGATIVEIIAGVVVIIVIIFIISCCCCKPKTKENSNNQKAVDKPSTSNDNLYITQAKQTPSLYIRKYEEYVIDKR